MHLVVPGDFLCYSEEYLPNANTFEGTEGKVFSSVVGCEQRSDSNRNIVVASNRVKRPLKPGDLVYARVEDLYDTVALTRMRPASFRVSPHSDSAFLRISEIRRGYVERFRGNVGIGDVLVARVKEITPLGIYLTIIENDLGVIRAYCSACRSELTLTPKGFYCKACGAGEDRKMPAPGSQPQLFVQPASESQRSHQFDRRSGSRSGDRRLPRSRDGRREGSSERGKRRDSSRNRSDYNRSGYSSRGFSRGSRGSRDSRRSGGGSGRSGRRGGGGSGGSGSGGSGSGFRKKNIGSYYPANP